MDPLLNSVNNDNDNKNDSTSDDMKMVKYNNNTDNKEIIKINELYLPFDFTKINFGIFGSVSFKKNLTDINKKKIVNIVFDKNIEKISDKNETLTIFQELLSDCIIKGFGIMDNFKFDTYIISDNNEYEYKLKIVKERKKSKITEIKYV